MPPQENYRTRTTTTTTTTTPPAAAAAAAAASSAMPSPSSSDATGDLGGDLEAPAVHVPRSSDAGSAGSSSGKTRHNNNNNSKSLGRDVPVVELSLRNVTYAPATAKATAAAASGKAKRKLRFPPGFRQRGDGGSDGGGDTSETTPSSSTRTTVLKDVSTCVSPYKLTAWMGPSGSGKTSLISVAAALTQPGDLSPESRITVNGDEGRMPKGLVGVVWQDDLLLSNLTVEENVYFAARLKTPESTSDDDVRSLVEDTVRDLGLSHVRHSLVGSPLSGVRGVSGGERKRVSVASELVVRPSLLLLDEPTSGLDATTAQALVATLKDLANMGHSVAVVIHQPRTTIYSQFDHLLLLSKGRAIYDGEPSKARSYLESCPSVTPLPPETGIADWIMDVITVDERRKGGGGRGGGSLLADHWAEHAAGSCGGAGQLQRKLSHRMSSLHELHAAPKFNVSFATQFKLLTRRTLKQNRGERLTATAALLQFAYLFFTALFWWRMPDNTNWVYERNSLLFFMLIAQANGICISAVTVFQRERTLLRRERAKKMYGVASYFLGKIVSDMTNNVLLPFLYGMLVYWTANFRMSLVAYLQFGLAFYLSLSTAQAMGLFLSIAIPSPQVSLVLAPPITLFFMIMGGFYIPFENMHPGVEWLSWLSFARYGYSAMVINEFAGREIPCAPEGEVGSVTIGSSGECPLPGDDVVRGIGIYGVAENYWFNIVMVIALQLFFRFSAYALLRRMK